MSLLDIGAEATSEIDTGQTSGFGPDRSVELEDTDNIPLAPAPRDVPEFVLNRDGSVPNWSLAAQRFRRRIEADSPHLPRFDHNWACRTRAKLLRAEQSMRKWVNTTVMLTYTGEPILEGASCPMPPVPFTTALTASRPARREAMRDLFEEIGGRWLAIRVMGSHQSGYPHEHVLIGTESQVSGDEFESVVTAHRAESPIAGVGEHGSGAISVEQSPNTEGMTRVIKYTTKNLPGIEAVLDAEELGQTSNGVLDEEEHMVRTSTVLEATGKQAFRIDSSDGVEQTWY